MDTNLQIFTNEEFGYIRTIEIDGEPWMVGKDVAKALGYTDTKSAIQSHVDEEDKRIIQRGQIATLEIPNRGLTIINESGMYSLVFGSKLEDAKRFKHWVTSEVLPAIRKTGRYIGNNAASRLKNATLPEITDFLHETSSFLREMDKVMRDQNSHPSDIAKEFKHICDQFGVIELSDDFVKEVFVEDERYRFYTLEELGIE